MTSLRNPDDKLFYDAFLTVLKELRKSKGLTQAELGVILKRPPSYISKIEKGVKIVDLRDLIILMRAYDTTLEQFCRLARKEIDSVEHLRKKKKSNGNRNGS